MLWSDSMPHIVFLIIILIINIIIERNYPWWRIHYLLGLQFNGVPFGVANRFESNFSIIHYLFQILRITIPDCQLYNNNLRWMQSVGWTPTAGPFKYSTAVVTTLAKEQVRSLYLETTGTVPGVDHIAKQTVFYVNTCVHFVLNHFSICSWWTNCNL